MIQRVKAISESRFVRNVAIVAIGTAGAQAITMAFAPIITRLYGPEAFGVLGTFMAILTIASPVAALTYPIAIVLAKSDTEALGLAKLSAGLALFIVSILTVVLVMCGRQVADLLNLESITSFLLLIPVAMLLSAMLQILQQWLIRKKQFKITAKVSVIQSFTINSLKVGLGIFQPIASMLIILATLGSALHILLLLLGMKKSLAQPDYISVQESDKSCLAATVRELACKHKDFPLYRAPQVAINAFSQGLPIIILAGYFGPVAAGFYSLGKTVLEMPSMLISKSVGDVFYPRITEATHNNENLFYLILKATLALAVIGFFPFFFIICFGPWLFSFVFGSEWYAAGEYARWLALWLYFGFINKPAVTAVPVLNMQAWLLFYEVFSTGAKVITLTLGFYYLKSDIHAIAMMCITGVIAYIVLIASVLKKSAMIPNYEKASK